VQGQNVAGVNIASDSIDPLGRRIAVLMRESYGAAETLEDVVRLTMKRHPELGKAIQANGGGAWLDRCEHQGQEDLSGKGQASLLIKALVAVYQDQGRASEGNVSKGERDRGMKGDISRKNRAFSR
jgi:hypothetical protein